VGKRVPIIRIFQGFYIVLVGFLFWGGRSIAARDAQYGFYYQMGRQAGEITLCLFIVTLIPGMLKRYGIKHKLISLVVIFRRYIGITTYLFALIHVSFLRLIPWLTGAPFRLPLSWFETFGLVAHIGLLLLCLTSNDWSLSHLKIWWYRLHRIIYLIMWLILFHVGLQQIGLWTILMGSVVFLMMGSFVWQAVLSRRNRLPLPNPPMNNPAA
jgi:sulfoxide reductase heme-binding subunit YedZ